jgi:hypothetical protein
VEQRDKDTGATRTDGVAKGNGTAACVDSKGIEVQLADATEGLGGEGLVDFEKIDRVSGPTSALKN